MYRMYVHVHTRAEPVQFMIVIAGVPRFPFVRNRIAESDRGRENSNATRLPGSSRYHESRIREESSSRNAISVIVTVVDEDATR